MPTKDELETRLYERMSQENKAFLTEMKAKSPDEIISHAYEIACRDNCCFCSRMKPACLSGSLRC